MLFGLNGLSGPRYKLQESLGMTSPNPNTVSRAFLPHVWSTIAREIQNEGTL